MYKQRRLHAQGVVQGVGFRPFVYRLATSLGLSGSVRNLGDAGVEMTVVGPPEALDRFSVKLQSELPPLARIDTLTCTQTKSVEKPAANGFTILPSGGENGVTSLSGSLPPDISVCDDCLKDIRGPSRYQGYWATTCTNCGPRFTVIEDLPYDRPQTTMIAFPMCAPCRIEYTDPGDRRFHAQTIACRNCGPHLIWESWTRPERCSMPSDDDALDKAAAALAGGKIVAIKGIGGTHLACSAQLASAVETLRSRLGRPQQPFALMARESDITEIAAPSDSEWEQLRHPRKPIVLLADNHRLPKEIAPGLHTVGVMLPYSGLHHLLLDRVTGPLVMTSANLPGRPMQIDNEHIRRDLREIADAALLHNRRIAHRCDDSVIRVVDRHTRLVRRSRGYVPSPVTLDTHPSDRERILSAGGRVLALGADSDVTVAVGDSQRVIASQYIGTVDNPETLLFLHQAIDHLLKLTGSPKIDVVACDLHPGFLTGQVACELAARFGAPVRRIQHHEAHFASVIAEHGLTKAIGIVLDGYGYGRDASAWGGELFTYSEHHIERVGSMTPSPLPGGDLAARTPLRVGAGYLHQIGKDSNTVLQFLVDHGVETRQAQTITQQLDRGVNCPPTTSAGRFLDSVSAILGVCPLRTYEGEPAMKLESAAVNGNTVPLSAGIVDNGGLLRVDAPAAFDELHALVDEASVADVAISAEHWLGTRFGEAAVRVAERTGTHDVCFSGGVAFNEIITQTLRRTVERAGLRFHVNEAVPCGDGGISFGQVADVLLLPETDG